MSTCMCVKHGVSLSRSVFLCMLPPLVLVVVGLGNGKMHHVDGDSTREAFAFFVDSGLCLAISVYYVVAAGAA